MDANKLARLREIEYEIPESCDNCIWGSFNRHGTDFGFCLRHTYDHLKHTDEEMPLSIHRMGRCDDYVQDAGKVNSLGPWGEFFQGEWLDEV